MYIYVCVFKIIHICAHASFPNKIPTQKTTKTTNTNSGLGIKRAMTVGPILPGVPVWECGGESKFPGMKVRVF